MATDEQLRAQIDLALADYDIELRSRQLAFFQAHGRYFQGPPTHTTLPVDAALTPPDNLAQEIDDQPEQKTWQDLPAALPARLTIHTYAGPKGQGYIAIVEGLLNGQHHSRSADYGPGGNDVAWHIVTPEE